MKKWNDFLSLQSSSTMDNTNSDNNNSKHQQEQQGYKMMIKPRAIASVVSHHLENDSIISVDSGTKSIYAAGFIEIRKGIKFSLSGTLASMACG